MHRLSRTALGAVVVGAALACGSATRSDRARATPANVRDRTHVIPTRYAGDRFFGTPVMSNGDTLVVFLDTGGGTLMWESTVARYHLPIVDSLATAGRGYVKLVDLPAFRPDRSVPPPITQTRYGARLGVRATDAGFGSLIARSSLGQLGTTWFGDRVWTLDYPHRRLLLHDGAPTTSGPPEHRVDLAFRTDTAGHRLDHSPAFGIEIDGDSLNMILDTGATIWLTPDALSRVADGQPSERATSLVWPQTFEKWRARHPDWRVIENADLLTKQAMIEVPSVSIGGYDVGPVWFTAYVNGGNPPPANYPANTPTNRKMISGTIGGSALRYTSIVLDYPHATAQFTRAAPR